MVSFDFYDLLIYKGNETDVIIIPILQIRKLRNRSLTLFTIRDFPGGPVAKTPHSQCRGLGFDPWSGK